MFFGNLQDKIAVPFQYSLKELSEIDKVISFYFKTPALFLLNEENYFYPNQPYSNYIHVHVLSVRG